jgi:hypothetical protein
VVAASQFGMTALMSMVWFDGSTVRRAWRP